MKAQPLCRAMILLASFVVMHFSQQTYAEDLRFVQKAFVNRHFFLGFTPNTDGWLSVQRSADGVAWRDIASVATTNSVTLFVDLEARTAPRAFYRLRQPGMNVEEAEAKWAAHAGSNYCFNIQCVRLLDQSSVISGHVTITGGHKTVTNVKAWPEPVQPASENFPTVEELFTALKQAQQSGCWRVAVIYDPTLAYPLWCAIERVTSNLAPKRIETYRITSFSLTTDERGS